MCTYPKDPGSHEGGTGSGFCGNTSALAYSGENLGNDRSKAESVSMAFGVRAPEAAQFITVGAPVVALLDNPFRSGGSARSRTANIEEQASK